MTVTERILEHLRSLPEPIQAEVLDFVEYLEVKKGVVLPAQEEIDWSKLSLTQAMSGMEGEEATYSLKDLKEAF